MNPGELARLLLVVVLGLVDIDTVVLQAFGEVLHGECHLLVLQATETVADETYATWPQVVVGKRFTPFLSRFAPC